LSEPYAPLAPAPAGFTLDRALAATVDPAGTYHVGKLSFADRQSYNDFKAAQTDLGGTPAQLATLHALETTGVAPRSEPMQPAPPGTTAAQLLDVTGKTPNAAGFYELGTLRVQKDEYPAFAALQTGLTARNPEALAALYHMEHAPDQPVTFRVTGDDDRNDRFQPGDANQPGGNTISWNPHTMIRDAFNGARVAPDTIRKRLETLRESSNMQATAHAWLRDHYRFWNFWLTIGTLIPTAALLLFPLVQDDFVQRALRVSPDAFKLANAAVALIAFIAVLIQLVWKPDSLSAAHARAVDHYTNAKFDVRRLLENSQIDERNATTVEEKYLDVRGLPTINERRFLPLKRWHLRKVELSRRLSVDPWARLPFQPWSRCSRRPPQRDDSKQ